MIALGAKSLHAQEEIPIYNQYLFGSYFLINPAVAGLDNVWKVQAIHRQQWVGMEGSPSTQSIAGEGQIYDNLKMGGYVFMDENGYHRQNGYQVAFSYTLPLSKNIKRLRRLSFGLSYTGTQKYISQTDMSLMSDPALNMNDYNFFGHNSNAGIFMIWDGMYGGISGSHLLSGGYSDETISNSFFPRNWQALYGWKMKASRYLYIEPAAMVRVIENYDNHLDLNLKLYYIPITRRKQYLGYWIGFSSRSSWKTFPISSMSASLMLGGSKDNFYYGYSYEVMTDRYQMHHAGSHQIMIGYTVALTADRHCGCTPFRIPVL